MGAIESYGWRARVGMVKPSPVIDTNTHEFYLMAPRGAELFVTSWGGRGMLQEHFLETPQRILDAVPLLVDHKVDVIVQAGIPHLVALGWGIEETLAGQVAEVTATPFVTDIGVSIEAMQTLGCSRVAMLTPIFDDEITGQIGDYLGRAAITVVGSARVQDSLATKVGPPLMPLEDIYRAARALFQSCAGACDGLWITGAAMPSVAIIDELERDLQVPVVSSSQALMWAAMRLVGVHDPIDGFGRLYREADYRPAGA